MACLPLILSLLPAMMELDAGSSARVGYGCSDPAAPQGRPRKHAARLVQLCPAIFPTEELHVGLN